MGLRFPRVKSTRLAQLPIFVLGIIAIMRDAYASGSASGWSGLALLIVAIASGIPSLIILIVFMSICIRSRKRGQTRPVLGITTIILSILVILSLPGFLFFGIIFKYTTVRTWEYFASGCFLWIPVIILGTVSAIQGGKVMLSTS